MAGVSITLGGNFAALTQLQQKVHETVRSIRQGFTERVGHRMFDGVLSAARSIPDLMKEATLAASDFAEVATKTEQIFKGQAAGLGKWASTASSAFGQSKTQALAAASGFGNLFLSMGITEDRAADMSKRVTELASDLASFHNTSTDDAIQSIGAALRGEAEPIRKYGVLLDDATLKAAALARGLYDGKGTLTPMTRAMAAYEVVLAQTALAQGDFIRNGDGFANSTRTIESRMSDLKVEIGAQLLPTVEQLAVTLRDVDLGAVAGGVAAVVEAGKGLGSMVANTSLLGILAQKYAASKEVKEYSIALDQMGAALNRIDPRVTEGLAKSDSDIAAALTELEATRAEIERIGGDAIAGAAASGNTGQQSLLEGSLSSTLSRLAAREKSIRNITQEQLAANKAVFDAAKAESDYAAALAKSNSEFAAALKDFETATKAADTRLMEALPLEQRIEAYQAAEAKLRQGFNGALQATMGGSSARDIVAAIEARKAAGGHAAADTSDLATAKQLLEMEGKRADAAAELAKKQTEAAQAKAEAFSKYDQELEILNAEIAGQSAKVRELKREAEIRERIADLVRIGVSPEDAAARANAFAGAKDRANKAAFNRTAQGTIDDARALMAGPDAVRERGIQKRADELFENGGASRAEALNAARNEDSFAQLSDLRQRADGMSYKSAFSAVDSMQRIGGGGGVASNGLDYARQQIDLQRQMVDQLTVIASRSPSPLN